MNFVDYQKESERTCPSLENIKLDLCHMVLGINTEIVELKNAIKNNDVVNISEELADMHWYISNLCRMQGFDYAKCALQGKESGTISTMEYTINILYSKSAELQDVVKKEVAYNKEDKNESKLYYIYGICTTINMIYNFYNIDIHVSLQNNIDKLKIRFPEKFTEENAINRDLESERKELEK